MDFFLAILNFFLDIDIVITVLRKSSILYLKYHKNINCSDYYCLQRNIIIYKFIMVNITLIHFLKSNKKSEIQVLYLAE